MIMKALFIGVALLAGIVGLSAAEVSPWNYFELRIYDVTLDKLEAVLERPIHLPPGGRKHPGDSKLHC